MDSAAISVATTAAAEAFDVFDNIGIAPTTAVAGGGCSGLKKAAAAVVFETAAEMTVEEELVLMLFSRNFLELLLVVDFVLFGHCFRGRLIKVLTSWPVSGSNFRRFLAPLRRPRLLFLRLPTAAAVATTPPSPSKKNR